MTRDEARDALAKEIAAVPNANIVETLIRIVLDGRTRNSELVEGIRKVLAQWDKGAPVGYENCKVKLESLLPPDPATTNSKEKI